MCCPIKLKLGVLVGMAACHGKTFYHQTYFGKAMSFISAITKTSALMGRLLKYAQ